MKAKTAQHTPGPQPIGINEGNGLPGQRCAKCRVLCDPRIIVAPLGWCPLCVDPVRAAAPDLLNQLRAIIHLVDGRSYSELGMAVIDNARAAIAKAEGRNG